MSPDLAPRPAPPPGMGGPPPGMGGPPPGMGGPPPGMGGPPGGVPQQAAPPQPPMSPAWNDPSAFAATAPPPTRDEHEAAQAAIAPAPQPAPQPAPPAAPPPPPSARPRPPSAAPPPVAAPAPRAPIPSEPERASAPPTGVSRTEAQVAKDPMEIPPGAPRVLAGFLVGYEGNELGAFWPLYQGKNVVGRKDAADGLDIELDHPTTSSRHAVLHLSARPGAMKLEDPGSTNGTYLNEERVAKGVPVEVRDGDVLRFGGFTVTVKVV